MDFRPPSPWKWSFALAFASVILVVAKPYVNRHFDPASFKMNATDKNGRIELQWDARSDIVQHAQGAVLDVVDGNKISRYPVDFKILSSGALDCLRNADDTTVTLTLFRDGQSIAQAAVRSVGPLMHPPAPSSPPASPRPRRRSRRS